MRPGTGSVTLASPLRVYCDHNFDDALEVFADDLRASVGWQVLRVFDPSESDIQLTWDAHCTEEGYTLRVGRRVEIGAASLTGAAYALTTLRQLGPPELFSVNTTHLANWTVGAVDIVDWPKFAWRGAHLDVSRHFFDVGVVLRFIDQLAFHRMNKLHLHLNDDQGWRIEVPDWPLLTQVGAVRRGSPVGHARENRRDEIHHGGFYSREDIEVIVEHARRRQVLVIPEIDLPGHAQAVLAAYPQFANTNESIEVWTSWGVSENVLNVESATLDFAEDVVRYVASLFPGSPVHIGGDECPTAEWEKSPSAQAVMRANGFDEVVQLQGLYTKRLAEALRHDGHEVLAWDEVLDAEVPPGTVICAWRSVHKGIEAARRGFEVVMAPMQYLYFDWLSSDNPDEPVAVATAPSITTWERVYGYQIIPPSLESSAARHIRGAQVQLWTEYIDSVSRLDYMAFPRLSAFSEVVWGTSGDQHQFRHRLVRHLARLDAMAVAYRPLDPVS